MRYFTLFLAILACTPAFSFLERVDADGVTEIGGTSAYARMLPRTGSDGRIAASLLPPVEDWASVPIPGLYYVAGGAEKEGNGSPQYPFKTLTYALAHATAGSAVFFTPATYSGVLSLASGSTITLCGVGKSTYISSMTVTVGGSSAATELRMCNMRVGTLTITGGSVNVRISGTTIDMLAGNASGITVTRSDMGSYVSIATVSFIDAYAGNLTAPQAYALVNTDGTYRMTFSGGRVVVNSDTVAYLSDVIAATNGVYGTIDELREEDIRLAGLISSEAASRSAADTAIYATLGTATNAIYARITQIGDNWGEQISALSAGIGSLGTTVGELATKETNDVQTLRSEIAAVPYAAADATLAGTLRAEMQDGLATLRNDVPGIAGTVADTKIANAKAGIVSEAVTTAEAYTDTEVGKVKSTVQSLSTRVTTIGNTVDSHSGSIKSLNSSISTINGNIKSLTTKVDTNDTYARGHIGDLETWQGDTEQWRVNTIDSLHRSTINQIIACLDLIKQGKYKDIDVPPVIPE